MLTKFFAIFIFAVSCVSVSAQDKSSGYLNELVAQAREKNLATHTEWLKLVHYDDGLFGYSSQIISKNFFNAPDGMENPQAELEATLASFFSDKAEADKEQNPQCQFIARYHWLDKHLKFDPLRMKKRKCQRFREWVKNISPRQVTLIFPAGTDNSPSSMFGHTLFRIDKIGQTEKTRLFSYSINFAAETDETNGLVFAVKGIFGGYPGRFSTMPYYEKVKQYNDMEHRDIWEYQLNLSPEEIERLLQHTWELGNVDFAYYFFLENCSYQLLGLLDVARPGHDLTGKFSVAAIPSDTVTAILEEENILKKAVYRPSVKTRLHNQINHLDSEQQDYVLDLVSGAIRPDDKKITSLPVETQALVIITAYDYLQYKFNRGEATRESAGGRSLMLLRARNKLDVKDTTPLIPTPEIRFDNGHGTSRIALGGGRLKQGVDNEEIDFTEIKMRPSYHDLLDLSDGYTRGAQINFFDITMRYDEDNERARLHEFILIDIFSLSPRDKLFKPISWHVTTGFNRMPIDNNYENRLVYSVDGGFGWNYGLTDDLNVFAMIDITLLFHDKLNDKYAGAAGPRLGLAWRLMRNWNIWLSGRVMHYQDNLDMAWVDYRFEQNIAFSRNTALRISASETGNKVDSDKELKAAFHWYF